MMTAGNDSSSAAAVSARGQLNSLSMVSISSSSDPSYKITGMVTEELGKLLKKSRSAA